MITGLQKLVERRPDLLATILAGAAMVFGAWRTFQRATTPWTLLPDNDYWSNIRGLITENGLNFALSNLLRHNNEHVVLIPKLIYATNYLLTSGSNIGLIVYSICVGIACLILLLALARDLLREMPMRWVACAVLFPLAMFSAKLSHSYYFGMSGTIWLTADLFVILSAAALAKAARTNSVAWLCLSLLVALIGVLTYSTAIYALLIILVFTCVHVFLPKLRRRFPLPALAAIALVVVAVLAGWMAYRTHPSTHPPLDFDPVGLAAFVLTYLGSSVSSGYWPPVMGFLILAVGALSIRRLLKDGRGQDMLLWVILFLYAPFNGVMTGIGRLGYGIGAAKSSRYQSVVVISLIATIVLVFAALPKEVRSRREAWIKGATIAALAAMAVYFVVNYKTVRGYAARIERKPIAEIALRLNLAGDQHIRAATPNLNQFHLVLPALRASRHVPFNAASRCESFVGQHLVATGEPEGAIDNVASYAVSRSTQDAIELSGWAEKADRAPDCIAIIDATGIVIGVGVPVPDRTTRQSHAAWRAVASYPQHTPVCALALFADAAGWVPLASCKSSF
jgi:hypothetical protein